VIITLFGIAAQTAETTTQTITAALELGAQEPI